VTTCAICKSARHARTREKLYQLRATLAELGVAGEHAHVTCVVEARQKARARAERRGLPHLDPLRRPTARKTK
jgi:hypothetical protein